MGRLFHIYSILYNGLFLSKKLLSLDYKYINVINLQRIDKVKF